MLGIRCWMFLQYSIRNQNELSCIVGCVPWAVAYETNLSVKLGLERHC